MTMIGDEKFAATVTLGEPAVVTVVGAIDAASVEHLVDAVNTTGDAVVVVLDLGRVTLLDSVALARLVQLVTEAAAQGTTVRVGRASTRVERVATLDPHAYATLRTGDPSAG